MKTRHTPGPWHHDEYGHICAGPNVIGEVYTFELNDKQRDEYLPWEGNAKLIAVAPKLLDALNECVGALDDLHYFYGFETKHRIEKFDEISKKAWNLIYELTDQ